MTSYREFSVFDLLKFANVNFDPFTETYSSSYYMQYMTTWPEYMKIAESPVLTVFDSKEGSVLGGRIMGYMIAKSEGVGKAWHGHVTALSVAPEYRRMGLASRLMLDFEDTSERKKCVFADLFVRASNKLGNSLYTKLGYVIYRRVLSYYSGGEDGEDAFDMRKALTADKKRESVIPLTKPITVDELEFT
nr:n acetyltransferase [Hymenolepis microstoma]